MPGYRFTRFIENKEDSDPFQRLLKLFMQMLNYTAGDAAEALSWMSEMDKKYNLTDDQYGIGDFIQDLYDKGYIKDDGNEGNVVLTAKSEQSIRKQSLEEIFGKLKKAAKGS